MTSAIRMLMMFSLDREVITPPPGPSKIMITETTSQIMITEDGRIMITE
jgi:hypothetical protein